MLLTLLGAVIGAWLEHRFALLERAGDAVARFLDELAARD